MRLALVSLDQIWHEKKSNFDRCVSFMKDAKENGCELAIFPEMTLTGYSLDMTAVAELEALSSTLSWFEHAASSIGITSVFGVCLINPHTQKPRNTLCVARPNSKALVLYSKIHPFSFVGEEKTLESGNCLGITKIGDMNFGTAICYDLRFPELYAAMARRCDAIITIANWPKRRGGHWRSLLAARAIENQCFMVGVNRIGIDANGLHYQKNSIIVSPDGELVDPLVPGGELDVYDINPVESIAYRSSFPTLRDKRYQLYSDLLRDV
jgi:omega-amidase